MANKLSFLIVSKRNHTLAMNQSSYLNFVVVGPTGAGKTSFCKKMEDINYVIDTNERLTPDTTSVEFVEFIHDGTRIQLFDTIGDSDIDFEDIHKDNFFEVIKKNANYINGVILILRKGRITKQTQSLLQYFLKNFRYKEMKFFVILTQSKSLSDELRKETMKDLNSLKILGNPLGKLVPNSNIFLVELTESDICNKEAIEKRLDLIKTKLSHYTETFSLQEVMIGEEGNGCELENFTHMLSTGWYQKLYGGRLFFTGMLVPTIFYLYQNRASIFPGFTGQGSVPTISIPNNQQNQHGVLETCLGCIRRIFL